VGGALTAIALSTAGIPLAGITLAGCPVDPVEPDADIDAFRRRLDTGPPEPDAPGLDAAGLDAAGLDAAGLDAYVLPFDAGPPDAGPIDQCEGVPVPTVPCQNDDDCRTAGMSRCILPIPNVDFCMPCMGLIDECMTDMDCFVRATTDAGPEFSDDAAALEDAGPPAPDAWVPVDAGNPADLVCNTYGASCVCPRRVCEIRCTGPTCPGASCETDGYVCPVNTTCSPSGAMADDHGCAPKACTTSADCDCGFCTPSGLCANGAGTCE
jgi:hypothetical protein